MHTSKSLLTFAIQCTLGLILSIPTAYAKQLKFFKQDIKKPPSFYYRWSTPYNEEQINFALSNIILHEELGFYTDIPMESIWNIKKRSCSNGLKISDIELNVQITNDDGIELSISSYQEDVMRIRSKEAQQIPGQAAQNFLKTWLYGNKQ